MTWFRRIKFLKSTTLLIPVPLWERFMAIRVQKVALLEVCHYTAKVKFNCEKHAEICWHVWQSVYNLNADTVTWKHKNRPYKISPLISFFVPYRGKRLRNYLEIWRSHKRLGDKSMSSHPHFSLERKESLGSHEECGKVFHEKTINFAHESWSWYDQETFFGKLDFSC